MLLFQMVRSNYKSKKVEKNGMKKITKEHRCIEKVILQDKQWEISDVNISKDI